MDLSSIVRGVIDVAQKLSPLLAATPVGAAVAALPAAVAAGKSVIELIDQVKAVANTEDQAALDATRAELEPKVMAHLDRTIESLG